MGEETVDGPEVVVDEPARFPGYVLEGELGRGGGGQVYRARRLADGVSVALKMMDAGAWTHPRLRLRFQREIGALARLKVEGALRVLDAGTTADGVPWFAMPLVEGPSLAEVLGARGSLPPQEAARVVQAVAETLARVHAEGVVHRDVKPGNILLETDGAPLLADFGLALDVSEDDRLTRTHHPVGTPRYMAPEQRVGLVEDWRRVDTYALGVVLYECLGGRLDAARHQGSLPGVEGAPSALVWIARRAADPLPTARYPSAAAMAADLAAWREQRARGWLMARLRGRDWLRRNRRRVAVVAAALLGPAAVLAGVEGARALERARHATEVAVAWGGARDEIGLLRARGQQNLADARFQRFVQSPSRHGAPALGAAWLTEAGRLEALGREEDAIDALGSAAMATADPATRRDAIEGLLRLYAARGQRDALSMLVGSLPALAPDLEVPDAPRASLALAFGDIPAAAAHLPPGDAALLAPFALTRPVEGRAWQAADLDADGLAEPLAERGFPEGSHRTISRDGQSWSSLPTEAGWALARRTAEGFDVVSSLPAAAPRLARVGGRTFVYTIEPRLLEIVDVAGGWEEVAFDRPPLRAYLLDIMSSDLDGDGQEELIVAHGPPQGYMIEVLDVGEKRLRRRAGAR